MFLYESPEIQARQAVWQAERHLILTRSFAKHLHWKKQSACTGCGSLRWVARTSDEPGTIAKQCEDCGLVAQYHLPDIVNRVRYTLPDDYDAYMAERTIAKLTATVEQLKVDLVTLRSENQESASHHRP